MSMYSSIANFHRQFEFKPVIENKRFFRRAKKFIITGMGGSQLAADILRSLRPDLDIILHRDYGLPQIQKDEFKNRLIIASSYSGDTEETLDSFAEAVKKKYNALAISTGGQLLELAQKYKTPYIQIPNTGIQPRMATGFNLKALFFALGLERELHQVKQLSKLLTPKKYEVAGKKLAKKLKGFIPMIYASSQNQALAYNWKIKLNETGKIPAFCNVISELNHNEMNAFDVKKPTHNLCNKFYFIFLQDSADHPRVRKRMEILEKMYRARKLPVICVIPKGKNSLYKLFSSIILADWTAYYTAKSYGLDPEEVPMVEEFKRLMLSLKIF